MFNNVRNRILEFEILFIHVYENTTIVPDIWLFMIFVH